MTDRDRAGVYGAEDQLGALLDRGGLVQFHGSTLDVPRQRRFGDLEAVRRYLAQVRAREWGGGDTPPPVVRGRRGEQRAHWEAPATIAIPAAAPWALRELVVLHEYAHHVAFHTTGTVGHGADFRRTLHDLVEGALGPEAALLLLAAYDAAGLSLTRSTPGAPSDPRLKYSADPPMPYSGGP